MSRTRIRRSSQRLVLLGIVIGIAIVAQGCASSRQKSFTSAQQAVDEFIAAVRAGDRPTVEKILGPEADEVLSSGDSVADQQQKQKFLAAYDEKHQLSPESDGVMTLSVGNEDWPLPIPLVQDQHSGRWRFDTEAGKDEVLSRRIGRNELDVIEVCQAIVDAQMEYALNDPDGDGVREYAEKFLSDAGMKNGLYWPTADAETPSPLGPFIAEAVEEQYVVSGRSTGNPQPYHGYCYRMLKSQGADAPGGALDYVVNGNMIGGFAAVAYPADYENSGIMSFMVSHAGVVYQTDLGPDSAEIAKAMQSFDPGEGWEPLAEPAEAPASDAP